MIFLLSWSFSITYAQTPEQLNKVILRAIADEFLNQLNDSTTRILPITKIQNRYKVTIENPISFPPDALTFSTLKIFQDKNPFAHYLIEVEKCDTSIVMYSLTINMLDSVNNIACKQRALPKDCYSIYFTEIKKQPITTAITSSNSTYHWFWFLLPFIFAIAVLVVLKQNKNPDSKHLIEIGDFELDTHQLTLSHKSTIINLSGKETQLLALLAANSNATVARQSILNRVWQDEGDYVGRTLDVFISKLRKRLSADENIEIINERGVGYRLVIKVT